MHRNRQKGKPLSSLSDDSGVSADNWGERNIGKPWQIKFFRTMIRLGGRRAAYHIMYFVVLWYVLTVPAVRRRTRYYLDRRFPLRQGRIRRFFDSYRLVCVFGRSLIDRFVFAVSGNRSLRAECVNLSELQKVLTEHCGVVLLNAHVGCWQVAMSIMDLVEKPVSVVMIPPGPDQPGSEALVADMPFQIIDPRHGLDSVLAMMQSLRRGEILGLMGDRVFGSEESTVRASFLGGEIRLPFSPYRLAGAAGAPIIVLFSYKTGFSRYQIKVARVIKVPSADARSPRSCEPYAQEFADALEEFVWEHPWQYFNFYDLWS